MNDSIRDYSISDADLMMFASNLANTIRRDITQFAEYNVDADAVDDFEELGNQFEVFPPDSFYLSDIGIANENKESKRNELIQATRKITNRALAKWGISSPQYNKFGVKNISKMTDKELLATSRLVVLTATDYLTQLSTEGLTQLIIDNYVALIGEYETSLNELNTAIQIRDVKTKERILLGNQLYALVTRYCTFGKTIWEYENEAKYNDYIIYTPGPGSISAPVNLFYDNDTHRITWNDVENATSYECVNQLSESTDNWKILYSGANTYALHTGGAGTYKVRVRARNAGGFGKWSEEYIYEYS